MTGEWVAAALVNNPGGSGGLSKFYHFGSNQSVTSKASGKGTKMGHSASKRVCGAL